ncbi:MAG: hypothetical protein ACC682_04370 [Gemmatimonadota bacterium]
MDEHASQVPMTTGDTALVRFLFPKPAERRTGAIVAWWEKRRIAYNLIVGGAGLATMGLATVASLLPPDPPRFYFSFVPIVVVGILANVCYTLGPIVEVATNRFFGRKLLPIGPTLFRNGLVFSVGVVFVLPTIIMTLAWLVRVVFAIF